jgi:hypothetical protein
MEVLAQMGWLEGWMVALAGVALGGWLGTLWAGHAHQRALDTAHQRCWDAQASWLAEHDAQWRQALQDSQTAQERAAAAEQVLAHGQRVQEETVMRVRRELDAARAGNRQAEQALCQQLLAQDRQMAAERSAHRREVQALRLQCDALGERLVAERELPRIEALQHQQVCEHRDRLREEVAKLLELLEQSDTAQAALQHRANVLEQQMVVGQRQLEELRHALLRERERQERRVYPARLPPGAPDRRLQRRQTPALAA